jgi:hypothetical protein
LLAEHIAHAKIATFALVHHSTLSPTWFIFSNVLHAISFAMQPLSLREHFLCVCIDILD